MQLQINPGDGLPIYRQIVRQIADAIAGGGLSPGEKLPSHRDLASELVIAPLTVKKAYDELEREGLLGTRRGLGTFVAETLPKVNAKEAQERLKDAARRLLLQASLSGVGPAELARLLRELREEMSS